MSRRAARLAWSLWALSVALAVSSFVFAVLGWSSQTAAGDPVGFGALVAVALAFTTVGALIASRRPENAIGWIFCAVGFAFCLGGFTGAYASFALFALPGSLPGGKVMAWVSEWVGGPGLMGVFAFLLLLFPDGRLPTRRWRPVVWIAAIAIIAVTFAHAFGPGPLRNGFPSVTNPFGIEKFGGVRNLVESSAFLLMLMTILASVISLVLQFRRARQLERQQIKWFAYAGAFLAVVFIAGPAVLWSPVVPGWIWPTVFFLGVAAMPVSAGIAILRYRLYDIDLVINRTLVYGALTVALATTYFGAVVSLQYAFRLVTGGGSQLAIIASTLVIAALFNPLRWRVQDLVDRRFYRRKYNVEKTLAAFSTKLRDQTDLDSMNRDLISVVRDTMQPEHVSLWLQELDRKPGSDG